MAWFWGCCSDFLAVRIRSCAVVATYLLVLSQLRAFIFFFVSIKEEKSISFLGIQGAEGRAITSDQGQVSGKLNMSLMDLVVTDGRESPCSFRVRGHKSIRAGLVL